MQPKSSTELPGTGERALASLAFGLRVCDVNRSAVQGCRKLDLRIGFPVKIPTPDISVNNTRRITYVNPVIDTFVDIREN